MNIKRIFLKSSAPCMYGEPMKYCLLFGHIWFCWSTVRFRLVIDIL